MCEESLSAMRLPSDEEIVDIITSAGEEAYEWARKLGISLASLQEGDCIDLPSSLVSLNLMDDTPEEDDCDDPEVLTGVEAVDMHTDLESLFPVEATQLEN